METITNVGAHEQGRTHIQLAMMMMLVMVVCRLIVEPSHLVLASLILYPTLGLNAIR